MRLDIIFRRKKVRGEGGGEVDFKFFSLKLLTEKKAPPHGTERERVGGKREVGEMETAICLSISQASFFKTFN